MSAALMAQTEYPSPQHPPIPEAWWQLVRDHRPPYNTATTPGSQMGAVPELLRTWPGARRSSHPVTSFAAIRPNAEFLIADHVLEEDTGDRSPVGRLYELDGLVLLLGVTHWNNTSLHLAEFRAAYRGKRNLRSGAAMLIDGQRQWVAYETLETYAADFGAIGEAFDATQNSDVQQIGNADVRLFKQRAVVDSSTLGSGGRCPPRSRRTTTCPYAAGGTRHTRAIECLCTQRWQPQPSAF